MTPLQLRTRKASTSLPLKSSQTLTQGCKPLWTSCKPWGYHQQYKTLRKQQFAKLIQDLALHQQLAWSRQRALSQTEHRHQQNQPMIKRQQRQLAQRKLGAGTGGMMRKSWNVLSSWQGIR
jgi:hypothetical protein